MGTVIGEFGQILDFKAPRLVIGQMKMQGVELPRGHQVDNLQYLVDRPEVAHHVEHESAVGQVGPVLDDGWL